MAPPHVDDELEALLSADDKPTKPEAEAPPVERPEPQSPTDKPAAEAERSESKPPEAKPAAVRPAARPAPRKRSVWPTVAVVILVLLAAAVLLGLYANNLRGKVAALKGELETIKTQATGMEATAGKVADDLLPVIEENVAIAKIRAAAGDAEGAKYSLLLAKRYADMADKLSGGTPPGKLRELTTQIEETGTAVQSPESGVQSSKAAGTAVQSPESGVQSSQGTAVQSPETTEKADQSSKATAAPVAPEATATEGQAVPPGG
ncbi:MAG: hypothetical protein FJX75_25900 [Armatimonadetes bacterium]|nr:hypothetical protein [Armatimonadota bacterium]